MWTSSEDITNSDRAFAFIFNGYFGEVTRELTTREKKEKELVEMKKNYDIALQFAFLKKVRMLSDKELIKVELEKIIPEKKREIEEADELLRNIGDDSEEKAHNIKIVEEKRRNLWLETPVEEFLFRAIKPRLKDCHGLTIRPVADKKWQGKL